MIGAPAQFGRGIPGMMPQKRDGPRGARRAAHARAQEGGHGGNGDRGNPRAEPDRHVQPGGAHAGRRHTRGARAEMPPGRGPAQATEGRSRRGARVVQLRARPRGKQESGERPKRLAEGMAAEVRPAAGRTWGPRRPKRLAEGMAGRATRRWLATRRRMPLAASVPPTAGFAPEITGTGVGERGYFQCVTRHIFNIWRALRGRTREPAPFPARAGPRAEAPGRGGGVDLGLRGIFHGRLFSSCPAASSAPAARVGSGPNRNHARQWQATPQSHT